MKLVRKLVPVDFLDIHGIESWLEDMAARGLFFTGMGSCFARFRRGRPMPIRYHAEPSGSGPASLAREQVDYSAGRGWHYAGPFGQAFAVYWADDLETKEFHTDFLLRAGGRPSWPVWPGPPRCSPWRSWRALRLTSQSPFPIPAMKAPTGITTCAMSGTPSPSTMR